MAKLTINTIHLTLKMISAQVVEMSVTNRSFKNNPNPDDDTIQTTDTPGLKPLIYYGKLSKRGIWKQKGTI